MKNRTVLITGASSGIGRETAIYFSQRGWNVAATMRNPSSEKELQHKRGIKLYRMDVTDKGSIQAAFLHVLKDFETIDVIVNNAGYAEVGAFEASTEEQVRKQFETNVFGVMNVIREILPYFRERKNGIIINITSMGGRITFPLYSLYHGTKWAVEGFSESLHYELNQFNIRIKNVEPGAIKTDFYVRSMSVMQKEDLKAYDDYFNMCFPNMQMVGEKAKGPLIVAKKVYQAATDGRKKLRYPIGSGAPFLLFLRRMLPERWFFGLVRMVVERK